MYSVVLMAAMTTATGAPDCGFKGHSACYGGCYGSGYGSCYGSCYGSSCYGSSCYGSSCSGSCWGSSCYGSYSSCYGCYGGYGYSYSCHGCYGCWGCYGSCYGSYYMAVPPVIPMGPVKEKEPVEKPKDKESLVPTKAKLVVELPADAKLYIDDQLMKTQSATRQFNTPELQPGQTYYYMVRVEMMTDSGPQKVERRVLVRAGEEVTADFKDMKAPVATVKK